LAGSIDPTSIIELLYVLGTLLCAAGGIYASYWSFVIRQTMRVHSYRRQALVVGIVSLYGTVLLILFYLVDLFEPSLSGSGSTLGSAQLVLYGVLPPVLLGWADSSIRVGRRSDPLLRDTFRWSDTRWAFWGLMVLCVAAFFAGGGLTASSGYDSGIAGAGFVVAFIVLGVSVVAVFLAAKRSGDTNYRRSLEWFGAIVVLILIMNAGFIVLNTFVSSMFEYTPADFVWAIFTNLALIPLTWYSAYRCSRSLVPLNRMPLIDSG
jgi:uncharacterized membrane protein YhaH (DUF805 family)